MVLKSLMPHEGMIQIKKNAAVPKSFHDLTSVILTLPWLGLLLQVVQEIKMLRGSITQREKEKAERATLVQQERLIKSGVC